RQSASLIRVTSKYTSSSLYSTHCSIDNSFSFCPQFNATHKMSALKEHSLLREASHQIIAGGSA
ncbi:hypothetical protein GJAV_G00003320, partial [Gymnothorax javanicus]